MKEVTYSNIVTVLLEEFPEYGQSKEYDGGKEFPYATMGGFGRFIVQAIENEPSNTELIQRIFEFINEIYNGPEVSNQNQSDTIQNLLYIEIFENLAQTRSGVDAARKYLQRTAKDEFETVFKYTGIKDNDSEKGS